MMIVGYPKTAWLCGLSMVALAFAQAPVESCEAGATAAAAAVAPSLLAVKAETATVETEIPIDMTEGANVSSHGNSTNASLENIIVRNLEHDFAEANKFPDLDNVTNDTQGRHGLGQLGANLEFMMLKLAQLVAGPCFNEVLRTSG